MDSFFGQDGIAALKHLLDGVGLVDKSMSTTHVNEI
jgi:hypothetical protein